MSPMANYQFVATVPVSNPTQAFWQHQPDPVVKYYQSDLVPKVDVAIIGAGLTGTLVAYQLLTASSPNKPRSVAIFEAHDAASGATGRNGGHIKPDCYRGFSSYAALHGKEVAATQCSFEAANHRETIAFIHAHGLSKDVDLVEYRAADVYMTERAWANGLKSYNGFKDVGGDVSQLQILAKEEAEESANTLSAIQKLRVRGCQGAMTYPASSLWPYKLTTKMLHKALALGLMLHTNTPVNSVSVDSDNTTRRTLRTNRGDISAGKVIHATNGYASHLLPELAGRIIPLKGHVAAIAPPTAYVVRPLETSFCFFEDEDFDYLIQRSGAPKYPIWGGGELANPGGLDAGFGDCDDSTVTSEVLSYLRKSPGRLFKDWEEDGSGSSSESRTGFEWSGVMGLSKDLLPFIDEVPGKPGQYLVAGYHGHGMARIFLCTKGFCQYFLGEEVDSRIPASYFDLDSRLDQPIDLSAMENLM